MPARRACRFVWMDVFAERPFGGNQLAVFSDARGLTSSDMQLLAQEVNLAESAFALPAEPAHPTALRRVRIFTPRGEMRFAGHPTLGAAVALIHEGVAALERGRVALWLHLNAGVVQVHVSAADGQAPFAELDLPPVDFSEPPASVTPTALGAALGIEPAEIGGPDRPLKVASAGTPYLMIPVRTLEALRRAHPNSAALNGLLNPAQPDYADLLSAYLFTLEAERSGHAAHARMFNPHPLDLPEDAATGSAAGPLGAYLVRHGLQAPGRMLIEQGYEMGRPSLLQVRVSQTGAVALGGHALISGEGTLWLP